MNMWLSVRLTQLPLEVFETPLAEKRSPFAVIENNRILCCNQSAHQQGVKLGQSITTAYALCDHIKLFERNTSLEKQRLNDLALLLYQFSPATCIENDNLFLIEVGHSLALYSNLEKLLTLLIQELDSELISYQLGLGETPKSAELSSYLATQKLMSFWQSKVQSINTIELHQALNQLPLVLMNIPSTTISKIQSVGITTLGQLKKLPMSAITKRFGKNVSDYLLMLNGKLPDPKDYFVPTESFEQKLEFINVVHHREGLLFPIKRLLKTLCRFLTIKQKNSQCLHWQLFDSEKNSIGFDVLIADSNIDERIFFELSQLNLERYTLHAPIEAISLEVAQLNDLSSRTEELFESSDTFENKTNFINKIRAKLGNDSCSMLQTKTEHLPEYSFELNDEFSVETIQRDEVNNLTKPSWLLEKPCKIQHSLNRLIWQGELKIISHQERVTNYWWQKKVARDYYLAEHDNGIIYWVYFEKLNKQWFIHGIYS
jgi:protein ImuB